MSSKEAVFTGFKRDAFKFLADLSIDKNNNTEWFAKNRSRYDELVSDARLFVSSIGQFFQHLNPAIRTEPKFNKTLMRINKDMRFAKGAPYRLYFLIHFGRFKMDSEFFVYLDKTGIEYGVFLNNSEGQDLYFNKNFQKYKTQIQDTFDRFGINRKYDLYKLNKDSELITPKFNAKKDLDKLAGLKFILLEKAVTNKEKFIGSPNLLVETVKCFSQLYPVYCYAVSPDPLKLIEDFDERMGIAF